MGELEISLPWSDHTNIVSAGDIFVLGWDLVYEFALDFWRYVNAWMILILAGSHKEIAM